MQANCKWFDRQKQIHELLACFCFIFFLGTGFENHSGVVVVSFLFPPIWLAAACWFVCWWTADYFLFFSDRSGYDPLLFFVLLQ